MSWIYSQTPVFTPTGPTTVTVTDTPSAERDGGPDGTVAIAVPVTGDTPSAQRSGGGDGSLVLGVTLTGDTPSGQRSSGGDGVFVGATGLTDTPTAQRSVGPDGTAAIAVALTADTPSAQRTAGPSGALAVGVTVTADTPSDQRSGGPDGALAVGCVYSDTPTGQRSAGPSGVAVVDLAVTDTPSCQRVSGPDGNPGSGVNAGPDTPGGQRSAGPDGTAQVDLAVGDGARGARSAGPDGTVAVGVTFTADTASGQRSAGQSGSVFTDVAPGVTVTDAPGGTRGYGPDGTAAAGVVVTGDTPATTRRSGPDGSVAVGVSLTDTPTGTRYARPDGLVVLLVGVTDTPGAYRSSGPDGSMGIVVPVGQDTQGGSRYAGPVGVVVIGVGADLVVGPDRPTAIRVAGPGGQVLLAFLPTRIPYTTPTPLIAPSYDLWVADTVTGRMLWELPMGTCSWSTTLGAIGTIRATIEIEKTWDSLADQDERDPRILMREVLTGPWRFSLVLTWGNNVVWAGPYVSLARPGPRSVELAGQEGMALYTKRVMVKNGAVSAIDPTADFVYGPYTTKGHVAADLLAQALVGTGRTLPITITDPGGKGIDARTYYGYDLRKYWDAIRALSTEIDGPEIRLDPVLTAGSDANYLSWTAQIGTPHVGRTVTPWAWDSDVTSVVGFTGDASNMAQGVWSGGSGSSRDKLITHATDTSLLNIGWPVLEDVDTTNSSETLYPVLNARTAAVLAVQKQAVTSFGVQVPTDTDPMVGTYRVGEDMILDVRDDPVIPDGTYPRRIGAIAGTEKPWVTITDINPLPVGSL